MAQKALIVVIDEFEKAIAALAPHAPAAARKRLNAATGDLLEGLSTAAQEQASHAALSALNAAAAITGEVQQLYDDRKEDVASMEHNLGMVLDQAEIEQANLERHAAALGAISRALADLTRRIEAIEGQQLSTREVGTA